MQQKIQSFIENNQLLNPHAKVVVGISGGADSVALLHILHSLGYNCISAHCNFHLRDNESDRDEIFVRQFAASYGIPFESTDFNTTEYADTHKISIEMAARELRYKWFEELRSKHDAEAIAVAHHADDNVETLLLNLVRGTGMRGMTGIQVRNKKVIRPLLCCNREEIIEYNIKYDISYVVDSTNGLSVYKRNKIRNNVLPLLEEINPAVRKVLNDTIHRFESIAGFYFHTIEKTSKQFIEQKNDNIKINIKNLTKQPFYANLLYEYLSSYGFNENQVQDIINSFDKESGQIFFTNTHQLLHDRNQLIINEYSPIEFINYVINNETDFANLPIKIQFRQFKKEAGFEVSKSKTKVHFDTSQLKFPMVLRHWKKGDIFYPFGMNRKKKISDFFINAKFNRFEKDACWLLLSDNKIAWIVGHRTDNRFKISETTDNITELELID